MSTPNGAPGPDTPGGRASGSTHAMPLVLAAVAVIVVSIVVLFVLAGGRTGSGSAALQAGDCVPADGDTAVPCDDSRAAYRILDIRPGIATADARAACSAVAGVTAYAWTSDSGTPGTAYCFGNI